MLCMHCINPVLQVYYMHILHFTALLAIVLHPVLCAHIVLYCTIASCIMHLYFYRIALENQSSVMHPVLCVHVALYSYCILHLMLSCIMHPVLCAHIVWHCAIIEHPGPASWHLALFHLLSWHQKISGLCPCLV